MNATQQEDLYRKAVVSLGYVTSARLEETIDLQSKIGELGLHESLGDLLVKKGYLSVSDHTQVLKHIGFATVSIPGFTILSKIGQGGMGTVYKALQTAANRIVAMKVMSQDVTKDPSDVARFLQEARSALLLHHPNLVAAIDVGFSSGLYYFIMEFVLGRSCREIVKTKGPFEPGRVLDIAIQMVDALGYINQNRMVHRDVKPENILLTDDGVVKLCDFGLVKKTGDADAALTQPGFTVGTPFFMSPEQVRGDKDIDIRSDLYSLGASLFYLLAGKPPFEGRSAAETMSMHLKHPVPEVHQLNPQVSEDLSNVVRKLMSKDRRERYGSPRELKEDFDHLRQGSAPRQARQHAFQLQLSTRKHPQHGGASKGKIPWPLVGAAAGGVIAVAALFTGALFLSVPVGQAGAIRPVEPPARSGMAVEPPPVPATEPGKAEYEEAREIIRLRPDDLGAQVRALLRAVQKGKDGPFGDSARRDVSTVYVRLRKELASIDERAKALVAKEQFKEALDLWSSVQRLHDVPLWSEAVAAKIEEIDRAVVERYAAVRDKAAQTRDREEIAALRDRLTGWGLDAYLTQFDSLVAPPAPAPPLRSVDPKPKEERPDGWTAAMTLALQRDYPAAVRSLEGGGAADQDNLRMAARVAPEALALLSRMSRGQKVALSYLDAQGRRSKVEGAIVAMGPGRIEVLRDEAPVVIPTGEILPGTLAELFCSGAKDRETVRKAAVLFCLIEGDAETARRLQGESATDVDSRYWDWSRRRRSEAPGETEARRRFAEAERLYFDPGGAVEAAAGYRELLAKHGSTSFVRRNEAAIAARTETRKEFVLTPADLAVRGGFRLVQISGKADCVSSQKDIDPADLRENYVQAEFSVLPECEYKCWVYAGGCCQEVLAFSVQGDEMTVPKPKSPKETLEAAPGSTTYAPVKLSPFFLKRKHAEHGGSKQADRWTWIAVALPKYTTAGTKSVRLLTDQKGLAIGMVVVSASRSAPPREPELKDLERIRSEEPGYAAFKANGGGPAGQIRREVWEGVRGMWVRDLVAHPSFPDQPTRVEMLKAFDVGVDEAADSGSRIRGYIHAPSTGDYVFWIAADDTAELWLSPDDRPENKVLIASAPDWTGRHEWEKHASQKSRPILLRAGRRYYIEALSKQRGGGSHLSAGWKLPDGTSERPVPGKHLSPF